MEKLDNNKKQNELIKTTHNNVYSQLLVCVYSENPTDFPLVRFLLLT